MSEIKFGTDGWRAVIAEDYTYDNLTTVARATAAWVQKQEEGDGSVVISYDTRFQGGSFAQHVARVLASQGIRVRLSTGFATTPAVSWATGDLGATAGVVITASHNPPEYNGFKIKAHFGGPATPDMIAAVEAEMASLNGTPGLEAYDALVEAGTITTFDLQSDYVAMLKDRLDIEGIKESGTRLAYDAMYGAGQGVASDLLGMTRVVELGHEQNPGMHGQAPEPIERNLENLLKTVVDRNCSLGMATDGDADRIGLVDEEGQFVDSHKILALLIKYLHEEKGLRGTIVKTFSTTDMLDRMGEQYGLEVETTPIGFKYIAGKIVEGDVLVGGEESGGMAVKGHIPERDGLFIGLTVAEMMVRRERTLSGLVRELMDEFGPHYQSRTDLHTTEDRKRSVLEQLSTEGLKTVDGKKVTGTETLDGFKFRIEGGWLLFRPSGTEPVLRVYSEAASQRDADALVAWGVQMVNGG
ncbi:phosphoglucomutase/phosphomannomutase family protein [Rubrivirga sp.]|uniref:phosphoglucomutase/phosphomannomutase family protein n=1 Tax=Rubrivirga sp. TaxID=1885344 RepID=UPI003C7482C4